VFACTGEEPHDIAIRMGASLAHGLGYDTRFVGARAPVADLALLVTGERALLVAVSASPFADSRVAARELVPLVEAAQGAGARVIAGGYGYLAITPPPANEIVASNLADLVRLLQTAPGDARARV
jgi:hypothetical protein